MFCHKCGSQAIDGAEYCQKCGAKLPVANPGSRQHTSDTPDKIPQKKKRRALPLILIAAVAFIIILVILASGGDSEDTGFADNTPQPSRDYLTYTNEAEGISFRYPGFWEEGSLSESGVYFSDDSMTMIVYLLAPTVDGPKQPILNIRKAPVTQEVINEIFAATLSDIMPEGNMMATEIEDVAIGDLPGRRVTFVTRTNSGSDATYIRYIYFLNSFQYRIEFIGTTESMESKDIKSYIDDVMRSYIVTAPETGISSDGADDIYSQMVKDGLDFQGKVLLRGLPIDEVIGMYSGDVAANYGEFDDWANDCMMYGVHDYEESTLFDDGWIEFNMNGYSVDSFSSDPINLTFDGQSLGQGFDALVTILGNDYIIQGESEYSWWIAWYYDGFEVSFEFPSDTAGLDPDIPILVSVSPVT